SFEALLQSVTDYVIAINRNYQIIMANDLFKREFGILSDGFCYKSWKNRDEKCDNCPVERSFQDGQAHNSEETVVMKDGRTARMRIKSTPVKDDRGEIVYVLETATDITEKKHLENELNRITGNLDRVVAERLRGLQESEKRYRTIFERSRDAIILTDADGKILEINPAGVELFGFRKKEEVLQVNSAFQFLFEEEEDFQRFQKKIYQEGFFTEFAVRLRRMKAPGFDALITANVILDEGGQITGYVIIARDITWKKKVQERNIRLATEIEKRNLRLSTLNAVSMTVSGSLDLNEVLNNTVDKMLEILEPDSVRVYMYDKRSRVLTLAAHKGLSSGFIEKPAIQTRMAGEGLLGETVITNKIKTVSNLQRSEDPFVKFLVEEGLKSSIYMPLVSKGAPVAVMVVSSHTDFRFSLDYVDFLTAIGNQIGVAVENANLYENLKKAYQDLKEAQEQVIASEKLASLGKLSATIAHEINNPLAAVLTYTRLLMKLTRRDRFSQDRLGDIARHLGVMESETARCGEIVKNLLAFARQSEMTVAAHRVEDIIERTLILMAHDLEIKGIELVKVMAPDLPRINCDFRQIQQTFMNLVSNASEAMTAGGTLTVTAKNLAGDGFVEVAVSDTGCGIDEADLKNIFEPFFTTKEEGKGVGLGLSVAYGIIARHKGAIEVKSSPGEGTVFKVRLPAERSG
ncbi:MAG: PAS domain S-box protein, partial [Deltaproteobacteria bacterium]|nr:PAS domain S-box protein [Deltaproteobacteria bacterium]